MEEIRASVGALVQRVTRMFYEPHHIVTMDIMLHHLALDEEELADKLKLLPREFNKIIVRLRDDKLLSSETTSDLKEDGKQVTKTKFFLDFQLIRDVVKYKIYTMTQRLEKRLRVSESTLGFGCPRCKTVYSILDAQSFLSTEDYTFKCPECSASLVEKKEKEAEEKESISNVFSLMMEEISPLINQLKEIDRLGIPEMLKGKIILPQGTPPAQKVPGEDAEKPCKEKAEEKTDPAPDLLIGLSNPEEETYSLSREEEKQSGKAPGEIVLVNGVEKAYEDVTESDKEVMADDEYEKYFELFEKHRK